MIKEERQLYAELRFAHGALSEQTPEAFVEEIDRNRILAKALARLSSRERRILLSRFGFFGYPKKLREIGVDEGVQSERIRQIEAKALRKLRHPNDGLHAYVAATYPKETKPWFPAQAEIDRRIYSAVQIKKSTLLPEDVRKALCSPLADAIRENGNDPVILLGLQEYFRRSP